MFHATLRVTLPTLFLFLLPELKLGAVLRLPSRSAAAAPVSVAPLSADWTVVPQCQASVVATAEQGLEARCPEQCPFRAEEVKAAAGTRPDIGAFCSFRCVHSAQACSALNANTTVEDHVAGVCRKCSIIGCKTCATGAGDVCLACLSGYALVHGVCESWTERIWHIVYGIVALLALFIVVWLVDLTCRQTQNAAVLNRGCNFRSRSKLHVLRDCNPADAEAGHRQSRQLWPWNTNLLTTPVAGAGLVLHFNFQAMVIVWAVLVAAGWYALAFAVDIDLLTVGAQRSSSRWQSCILVHWGYNTSQKLLWAKTNFIIVVYVGTFLFSLAFALRQLRLWNKIDRHNATMMDYAAIIRGLPIWDGSKEAEKELEAALRKSLREAGVQDTLVGVSLCWDFGERADEVQAAVEHDLENLRALALQKRGITSFFGRGDGHRPPSDEAAVPSFVSSLRAPVCRHLVKLEQYALGVQAVDNASTASQPKKADRGTDEIKALVYSLKTSDRAFAVFQTQGARDEAIAALSKCGGVRVDSWDGTAQIAEAVCEPRTVAWANFSASSQVRQRSLAVFLGLLKILATLGCWTVFFEPYAFYTLESALENGTEPSFFNSFTLSMVVVVGNQVVYFVCSDVAERLRLHYTDRTEAAYVSLYFVAVLFNVMLDLHVTYLMAYGLLKGADERSEDGMLLADLNTFQERFESFAVQRELGYQMWVYAYPATFLYPFLIEPLVTIILPFRIAALLVRTHPELTGQDGEKMLACQAMDMSRYADILVDMGLAVAIFWFPGGYTMYMFVALALCHVFVYCFDHYRVLRAVPRFDYATMDIDFCAQLLLSIPCGMLLSCAVFKHNCQSDQYCVKGGRLIERCLGAFVLHVVVHCLLVIYVVPLWGNKSLHPREDTYQTTACRRPCSWFSANPVHCLRSKYMHRHSPPCYFFSPGKEHLLQASLLHVGRCAGLCIVLAVATVWSAEAHFEIGCHYDQQEAATVEDFGVMINGGYR